MGAVLIAKNIGAHLNFVKAKIRKHVSSEEHFAKLSYPECLGFRLLPTLSVNLLPSIEVFEKYRYGCSINELCDHYKLSRYMICRKLSEIEEIEWLSFHRPLRDVYMQFSHFAISTGYLASREYWSQYWSVIIMRTQTYFFSNAWPDEIFVHAICPVGRWKGQRRAVPLIKKNTPRSASFFDERSIPIELQCVE